MVVSEKFHKPERNEYNAFPGNAISFISYLVYLFRRQRTPTYTLPFSLVFPRSKSGIRYVSARWNIGRNRKDQQAIEIYSGTRLPLVPLHSKHELPCNRHLRSHKAHQTVEFMYYTIVVVSKNRSSFIPITEFKSM